MNLSVGNITGSDAGRLFQLTKLLYEHLYSEYTQMEVVEEMDESIILEYDHLDKLYAEKDKTYLEMDKIFQEKEKTFQEANKKLAEAEAEILRLKNELQNLKN